MSTQTLSPTQVQYQTDGFYIPQDPVLPPEVVERAVAGMDAVRQGRYDTGQPPQPSRWNPGDDLNELCKIELPQQADFGIRALVSHADLGQWAARVTGARMVQVWWTQLLCRVRGTCRHVPLPSEPCVRLSPHTAQANRAEACAPASSSGFLQTLGYPSDILLTFSIIGYALRIGI